MGFLISFAVAMVLAIVLHSTARRFVRDRLRYVDAAQKGIAPFIAGGLAMVAVGVVAAIPFVPFIGLGTALTAGLAVGSGVAAGSRDIRQGTAPLISNR